MEKEKAIEDMKKYVAMANEERNKNPHNVIVEIVDSLIQNGLIDEEGNIINKPEETGKQR